MASLEQKQELVEDIKRPIRYYKISISGYGGEYVFNDLSRSQYDYWKSRPDELNEYVFSPEDAEDVPDEYNFLKCSDPNGDYFIDWWEFDGIDRYYGVEFHGSRIIIDEVDSDDYEAQILNTVYDGDLDELVDQENLDTTVVNEFTNEDGKPIVAIYSSEKGSFVEAIITTSGKIDLSKLSFMLSELPVADNLLDFITYDGEEVESDAGDTIGKGLYVSLFDD